MKTIYKYPLRITKEQILELPKGAKLLKLGVQDDTICLWCEIDNSKETEEITFLTFGTGFPLPKKAKYFVGTCLMAGGNLLAHVYVEHKKSLTLPVRKI